MEISNQTFQHIRDWAKAKGIIGHGDTKTQTIKLGEEYGELCRALLRGDADEAVDSLGDMTVVMVSLAHMMGVTLEQCINRAYQEIKARNGTLFDGNFVKANDGTPYIAPNEKTRANKSEELRVENLKKYRNGKSKKN